MKIKLYATSDLHGYLTPTRYSDNQIDNMGLMKLAPFIQKDEHTLLIDNGDVLQGSPLAYVHHLKFEENIHPMALCFNRLGYDYVNIGNHEFNFGKENVHHYLNSLDATCLTRNILDEGKRMGTEYVIHEFDKSHRIALIGVTTQYIPNWEQARNIDKMQFLNAFDEVKVAVAHIKQNETVNGIVVVYHGGFEKDLQSGQATEVLTGENLGYQMCSEIEGIDLLISGHQHRSLAEKCHQTMVTQTAANGKEIAYVEWDLDNHTIDAKLLSANTQVDDSLFELFAEEEKVTQTFLDEPLGELKEGDLLIHDALQARIHKHPLVSFLNQVQFAFADSDLASIALFNDATGFNHQITMRDCVSTYVYPNTLVVLRISGEILKQYLEKCAEYFTIEEGKIQVSKAFLEPKPAHFNYDMVDGCEYTICVSNPIGQRITKLNYKGEAVKPTDSFTMAMSNYRAACGGDFFMLKGCEVVLEIQKDMVECLCEYITQRKVVEVNHNENVLVTM